MEVRTIDMMNFEEAARLAHEVNRAYCKAIGDDSQVSWEDAPQWQKQSAINGVMFHWRTPDATPEDSHEKWMEEKIKDGWVYGLYKDPSNKKHPCIIPYDQLPLEQRVKDYLFKAVCNSVFHQKGDE